MYKWFLILVFLILSSSFSDRVAGQVTATKNQSLPDVRNPKNPARDAPVVLRAETELNAEADRLYREGMKLAEAGQFSQAAETFQQAIRLDPVSYTHLTLPTIYSV